MLLGDEYEIFNTVDLDILLSDLPIELIKENISYQISNPMTVESDYSTIVLDKFKTIQEEYGNVEDISRQIDEMMSDFYRFIIQKINEEFDLDITYESMSNFEVSKLGHSLYIFLVLRYKKNVSTFIYKFIKQNKKMLGEMFATDDKRKDVGTLATKKKTKNKDDIRILSNLPLAIKEIINLDHEPTEFIDMCMTGAQYEGECIKEYIDDFTISGTFDVYLRNSLDKYDEVINEVQNDVKFKLLKNLNK